MTTTISSSTNTTRSTMMISLTNISNDNNNNEEDQLNRINLQALQNRDPYISKIVDQAQRVCVYRFIAEKREWERKDLEGTLFVYERICEPYHGFVILSTVSRETFVQIIKPSMEFKHSPNYEAFLQYKVDVGDIYGIWFISKNDCPGVTECLKRLTQKAKEDEQSKLDEKRLSSSFQKSHDILSLLTNAQDKFQETKRKQDTNNSDISTAMPAVLLRLFSTQESIIQNSEERGEELKKTLGISVKSALSVTELEKQLLQPSQESINEKSHQIQTTSHSIISQLDPSDNIDLMSTGRLMTPAEFQTLQNTPSPGKFNENVSGSNDLSSCHQCQQVESSFSKDNLRQLLVDILQNDEEFVTGLHNAYIEKQIHLHRLYS
ncbi:hypothetical protein I4U23_028148 [Adineta vaga]|nr:hypothetical protein I4U23_028148 [Adineta vaga]